MDHQVYKEVHFNEYCNKCKHKNLADYELPCSECLFEPLNLNTHRPIKYEEKSVHERAK